MGCFVVTNRRGTLFVARSLKTTLDRRSTDILQRVAETSELSGEDLGYLSVQKPSDVYAAAEAIGCTIQLSKALEEVADIWPECPVFIRPVGDR